MRTIVGRPAPGSPGFDIDGYRLALERYEAVSRSLLAVPVKPGFAWDRKLRRLVIRGEFCNVPRRFLDLSDRSEGYGNVDDRAHEFKALGIIDGDDLVRWMQSARRPRQKDFEFSYEITKAHTARYKSNARVRRHRDRLFPVGGDYCRACRALKTSERHWICNERAKERIARAREAKRVQDLPQSIDVLEVGDYV